MTPIGHAAVALVAGRPGRRLDPRALVVGGILPDVDWLVFWAPGFNAWHRVATHSVAFVLVAVLAVAWLWRRIAPTSARPLLVALALGAFTHLAVDACMDTNPTNGVGVAWLWPFDATPWSPFNVMTLEDNPDGWNAPLRAAPGVLRGMLWELPFAIVALACWRGRWRAAGSPIRSPVRPRSDPRDHSG